MWGSPCFALFHLLSISQSSGSWRSWDLPLSLDTSTEVMMFQPLSRVKGRTELPGFFGKTTCNGAESAGRAELCQSSEGEPLICRAAAGKCRVRTPHAWKHRPGKLGGLGPFAPCSCSAAGNPTQAQGRCWCSGCLRRAPRWQCLHVPNYPFPG